VQKPQTSNSITHPSGTYLMTMKHTDYYILHFTKLLTDTVYYSGMYSALGLTYRHKLGLCKGGFETTRGRLMKLHFDVLYVSMYVVTPQVARRGDCHIHIGI
jgi:hypothetical protein